MRCVGMWEMWWKWRDRAREYEEMGGGIAREYGNVEKYGENGEI